MTNLCDLGAFLMRGSRFDDLDSFRCHLPDGTAVGQMCGIGAFAERDYGVGQLRDQGRPGPPLDKICLLGWQ